MIIKYKDELNWGYVDNLANVVYQKEPKWYTKSQDMKEKYLSREGSEQPDSLECSQRYFTKHVKEELEHDLYDYEYTVSSIWCGLEENNVVVIMANHRNRMESDKSVLITNQECYLLNDEGQTIERLN